MSFAVIRDQEVAVRLLRNLLERGRIPNGMLFWGPGGVGKQKTALELAKAMLCETRGSDACDICLPCRKVAHGNHPDLKIVSPKDKTRLIKKEDVDEINELASLRPYESQWRIFIIQDVDRMNIRAQNHFLKTLEEPPGRSLFILVSEFPRMLLPTIRSRCQLVRFRALRRETVAELLVGMRDLSADVAASIAGISEGRISRALDLVDSEKRNVVLALAHRLAAGEDPVLVAEEFTQFLESQRKQIEASAKADVGYDEANELTRDELERTKDERLAQLNALVRRDIVEYLYLLATWYRDQWVYAETGDRTRVWNVDAIDRLASKPPTQVDAKLKAIEKCRYYLDRFIPEERVFRDLFLTLARG